MTPGTADPALRTGSLRTRVTVAVLVLLLAVIVTLCLVVNVILGDRLYGDARNQIIERARYAATLSTRGLSAQDLADDLTGQGITASVVTGATVVVGRDRPPDPGRGPGSGPPGGNARPPARPGSTTAPLPSARSAHISVRRDGRALRVTLAMPGAGSLQLTSSLGEIDRTLALLHRVELGTAAGILALAALILVFLVGATLSPLRRMRLVADRIRHGARGVRLRPTRPATDLGRAALALDEMLESLEAAEAQAQAAREGMRRLLADVSHDLRTPIAGVLAGAEQLLRHDPGRAVREERLVELIREGRRAGRLVDDLLLMTRLDAGEAVAGERVSTCEVREVLTAAVEDLRRRQPDREVSLDVGAGAVALDPDRLTRLVTNILDNAATAAGPNGSVRVQMLDAGHVPSTPIVVDISDDGPGVPPEQRERIFERLFRVDAARHTAGSGLGLPIARGLARAAGGEVRYVGPAAGTGRGALFRIELPPAAAVVGADHRAGADAVAF